MKLLYSHDVGAIKWMCLLQESNTSGRHAVELIKWAIRVVVLSCKVHKKRMDRRSFSKAGWFIWRMVSLIGIRIYRSPCNSMFLVLLLLAQELEILNRSSCCPSSRLEENVNLIKKTITTWLNYVFLILLHSLAPLKKNNKKSSSSSVYSFYSNSFIPRVLLRATTAAAAACLSVHCLSSKQEKFLE